MKINFKSKKFWIFAGIGAVVIIIIVFNIIRSHDNSKEVLVEKVDKGDIVSVVSGPGVVSPKTEVEISPYVMGRIVEIYVEEGQRVEEGDMLLKIDDVQYSANVNIAKSEVESMESRLEIARQKMEDGKKVFERQKKLYEEGLLSDQEYETAKTTYEALVADYESTRSSLSSAKSGLTTAYDSYSKTRYKSPIDGIVTRIDVEEGEIVVPGTTNIQGTIMMVIANTGLMEVEAEIDETDIIDVGLEQLAEIEVDAFPDNKLEGKVVEIAQMPLEESSLTTETEATDYEVRVIVTDAPQGLLSGMNATVDIITATREDVLYIPIQAVVKRDITREENGDNDGNSEKTKDDEEDLQKGVFIIEDETAKFIPIETGINDDQFIEVKSGLKKGQEVISGPYKVLRELKDGESVKIKEYEEEGEGD